MLKRLSLFFTILLLLSALVEAYHYHDDGEDHPQCSICAAIHQQAATGFAVQFHEVLREYVDAPYPRPVLAIVAKTFFTPFNSRAPPA